MNMQGDIMTDTTKEDIQNNVTEENPEEENQQMSSGNFREASYVVLFIAAVFVINAMETGSYRTPWPVAIVTALLGFGLLGYSFMQKPRSNN